MISATQSTVLPPGRRRRPGHSFLPSGLGIATLFAFLFVLAPLIVVIGAALNADAMAFPPRSVTLRWFVEALQDHNFRLGALVSFSLAVGAATSSTLFALPISLALRKANPNVARMLSLAFLGPLLVPTIIFALALYQTIMLLFGASSLISLFIGHVLITMPFPLRTIAAVAEGLDPALEDAASSVGAGPLHTFVNVTLPLIKPGLLAGFLFAIITSWNDFSISIFLSPAEFKPLPIQIYEYLLYQYRPVIAAVSAWTMIGSVIVIYLIDKLVGLNVFVGQRSS
ncbi:ABC transporter permease [Hyphomicrobiales bacterium]|nr:ABC transporter permease [Hyphomicrobiales bacterium]CAH1692371.1 ABC transporter permease subunit [Hyphomicrobiales bacterium]